MPASVCSSLAQFLGAPLVMEQKKRRRAKLAGAVGRKVLSDSKLSLVMICRATRLIPLARSEC